MRSFASGLRYERRNGRNRLTLQFLELAGDARHGRDDCRCAPRSCSDRSACWSERRELLAHGVPVTLGQRAFEILLLLVRSPRASW